MAPISRDYERKKTESNRRFNGLNHEDKENQTMSTPGAFLADIKEIRHRARQHLTEGAVTQNYGGKVEDAIALLNHAVATELVCVLLYMFRMVCVTALVTECVKETFAQYAMVDWDHLELLRERINQLGL